jgi:roadblock/LC7 domain-containing protein
LGNHRKRHKFHGVNFYPNNSEVTKDSHDWKLTYTFKNKNIKANAYHTKSIKKFLPNFKWAESASAFKVDIILNNHDILSAAKSFFEYKNMSVSF